MTQEGEPIFLELGDIILITAPTNSEINGATFFIEYLDDTKARLLNDTTFNVIEMGIKDGRFNDESVENVEVLSSPESKGYARQHGLLPGIWITIQFGGPVPAVINGRISSLEDDMIEIHTFPEGKSIYIDFGYKGIPEDLPIESFRPFVAPMAKKEVSISIEEDIPLIELSPTLEEDEEDLELELGTYVAPDVLQGRKDALLDADQIVFGEEMGEITQYVQVPESQKRYGLETQVNDLLDELLSTIPTAERSLRVVNGIKLMIERFKQLREAFSLMTSQGEITKPATKGAAFKPLANRLYELDRSLYWLVPIVGNRRKLYDVNIAEDTEYADVVPTTLAQAQTDIYDLVQQYRENVIPDGQNKYAFLLRRLNPFFTPFAEPTDKQDVITVKPVKTDTLAFVDNQRDFFSSVAEGSKVESTRFVSERYEKGISRLVSRDQTQSTSDVTRVPITSGDPAALKGFLRFPEPVLLYSHVNLPATNILSKAQLGLIPFNYWSFMNEGTPVTIEEVESGQIGGVDPDPDKYLSGITALLFEGKESFDDRDPGAYKDYLGALIPKTRVLFDLVKRYIKDDTSYMDIIGYLEPFLVYPDDITFKQYEMIVRFMESRILELKKKFAGNSILFRQYLEAVERMRRSTSADSRQSYMFKLTGQGPDATKVLEKYGIGDKPLKTAGFIKTILSVDGSRLYTSLLSMRETDLLQSVKIDELVDRGMEAANTVESKSDGPCQDFVMSKQYLDEHEMAEDNGDWAAQRGVFFDKKYDPTRYEIAESFTREQETMDPQDFKMFLTMHLANELKMPVEEAELEAAAIVDKERRVDEGNYAYIINDRNQIQYYVRRRNTWVLDPALAGKTIDEVMFCNLQNKCISIKKSCVDMVQGGAKVRKDLLAEIISRFDKDLELNSEEFRKFLDDRYKRNLENITALEILHWDRLWGTDITQASIGATLGARDVVISPYASLRDAILGQSDFVKKQSNIIDFANRATRTATFNSDESPYWLYCIETGVPLLPTFSLSLAQAYQAGTYQTTLEQIVASQGELSDDGGRVVDRYSGYVIRTVELDTDEGFDEAGYKVVSRGVIGADIGDILVDVVFKEEKESAQGESADTKMIKNIITTLDGRLNISVDSLIAFIIKNVTRELVESLPSKEQMAALMKQAKRRPRLSYNDTHDELLLLLTLGYYLVAIQTMMPSIRTRTTFPGCVRSFSGFPMSGNADTSGLKYIVCVAMKLRSNTRPWQRLPRARRDKFNEIADKYVAKLRKFMEAKIVNNTDVVHRIAQKIAYLKEAPPDVTITSTVDVRRWVTFLPPLHPIKVTGVALTSTAFLSSLRSNIEKGDPQQFAQMASLVSKMFFHSLHIQELIQTVINKEPPLLTNVSGMPLLENACCNMGTKNTLHYFVERERGIDKYNTIVAELNANYNTIAKLSKAAFLYDPRDTRLRYPDVDAAFSENTIYRAFIRFCSFDTGVRLDPALAAVCGDNTSEYQPEDSLARKIETLRREGRDYTTLSMNRLLQVVNGRNIVPMDLTPDISTDRRRFEDILRSLGESAKGGLCSPDLTRLLEARMDTYDMTQARDSKEQREFAAFLGEQIRSMTTNIGAFLKTSGVGRGQRAVLETIQDWPLRGEELFMVQEDETAIAYARFIKTGVLNMLRVYPTIILNEDNDDDQEVHIPAHWGLALRHQHDIQKFVAAELAGLRKFEGNREISGILRAIPEAGEPLILLMENTPFFADIGLRDEMKTTALNGPILKPLMTYYFLCACTIYIDAALEPAAKIVRSDSGQEEKKASTREEMGVYVEEDLLAGASESRQRTIGQLLGAILGIMESLKHGSRGTGGISLSNEQIIKSVLAAKEKEKAKITKRKGDLSVDELEVDNIMQQHRLGAWGLGQTRALYEYDEHQYEKERMELDRDALTELRLGRIDVVTEGNRDIYAMEDIQEQAMRDRVQNELLNTFRAMGDDDDFGEGDSDAFA